MVMAIDGPVALFAADGALLETARTANTRGRCDAETRRTARPDRGAADG